MKLNVFVASYDHRHGTDVRVFFNETDAYKWREEVAKVYWDEMIPDDISRPDNDEEAADVYFEHMSLSPGYFESFHVEECGVEGSPPPHWNLASMGYDTDELERDNPFNPGSL